VCDYGLKSGSELTDAMTSDEVERMDMLPQERSLSQVCMQMVKFAGKAVLIGSPC
jgi:hypothetical protein